MSFTYNNLLKLKINKDDVIFTPQYLLTLLTSDSSYIIEDNVQRLIDQEESSTSGDVITVTRGPKTKYITFEDIATKIYNINNSNIEILSIINAFNKPIMLSILFLLYTDAVTSEEIMSVISSESTENLRNFIINKLLECAAIIIKSNFYKLDVEKIYPLYLDISNEVPEIILTTESDKSLFTKRVLKILMGEIIDDSVGSAYANRINYFTYVKTKPLLCISLEEALSKIIYDVKSYIKTGASGIDSIGQQIIIKEENLKYYNESNVFIDINKIKIKINFNFLKEVYEYANFLYDSLGKDDELSRQLTRTLEGSQLLRSSRKYFIADFTKLVLSENKDINTIFNVFIIPSVEYIKNINTTINLIDIQSGVANFVMSNLDTALSNAWYKGKNIFYYSMDLKYSYKFPIYDTDYYKNLPSTYTLITFSLKPRNNTTKNAINLFNSSDTYNITYSDSNVNMPDNVYPNTKFPEYYVDMEINLEITNHSIYYSSTGIVIK